MANIKKDKDILRKKLLSERYEISEKDRELFSDAICKNLYKLACYRLADRRYLYSAIKCEVDLKCEILSTLRKKECYLPRCSKNETGLMSFYRIDSLDDLELGSFGVLEPKEYCEIDVQDRKSNNSVCIIPAISFDKKGYRLGYGKGYYDRFLKTFKGKKIGVVYSCLLLDALPFDRFDETVDFIVTENGVYTVNGTFN